VYLSDILTVSSELSWMFLQNFDSLQVFQIGMPVGLQIDCQNTLNEQRTDFIKQLMHIENSH